jgi:hypothetical protein
MVIVIPAVAKERASVEFIFTHFNTETGMGIHGKAYILAVGLLMSQYSVVGYDASAHMVCLLAISILCAQKLIMLNPQLIKIAIFI